MVSSPAGSVRSPLERRYAAIAPSGLAAAFFFSPAFRFGTRIPGMTSPRLVQRFYGGPQVEWTRFASAHMTGPCPGGGWFGRERCEDCRLLVRRTHRYRTTPHHRCTWLCASCYECRLIERGRRGGRMGKQLAAQVEVARQRRLADAAARPAAPVGGKSRFS
jgi:hypothetical protein